MVSVGWSLGERCPRWPMRCATTITMAAWVAAIAATIAVIQAVRKIPLQFAKRMVGRADATTGNTNRDFLPIKLIAAGVMPIIFAQALMFLPATAAQFMAGDGGTNAVVRALNDFTSLPYNLLYFSLVVIFTYVYTALIVNPNQYAEFLKRQNAFIPGVKPGESTAEYIDSVTTRITFPGSLILGLLSILPGIAALFVNSSFTRFFGGTSILIMIGVILDTLQQIETYLQNEKYETLIKDGKIQGRSSGLIDVGSGV